MPKISPKLNVGKLAPYEEAFVRKYIDHLTPEEMAERLNRSVKVIQGFIDTNDFDEVKISEEEALQMKLRQDFRSKPEYAQLRYQFTDDELLKYESEYAKLISQFKEDILPTEDKQICQIVELDIFLDRCKKDQMRALIDIDKIKKKLDAEYDKGPDVYDKAYIQFMEVQLAANKSGHVAYTNQHKTLFEKHQSLTKDLKGSRDQRIKEIENSKTDYIGIIKMLEDEENRASEDKQLSLMKKAAAKEKERLSKVHTYQDGSEDRPLLNADTVDRDD